MSKEDLCRKAGLTPGGMIAKKKEDLNTRNLCLVATVVTEVI